MTSHSDPLHRLCSIDSDLQFFNADEQQQHLGLMTTKERRQLQSMIKKVHQHIQKITNLQRTGTEQSSITSSTCTSNASPHTQHQQTTAINNFYNQKQIKQLYTKLKVIKERYSVAMQEKQIRQLENDMERYQQLQVIHGISGRLDVSSQIYEQLHLLKLSLTKLRREWKLDRIQDIVSSLAISSSTTSSSSPSSPISSLLLVPPPSTPSSTHSLSERHGHRWYPSVGKKWSSSSSSSISSVTKQNNSNWNHPGGSGGDGGGLVGVMKNWFRNHTWTSRINKASAATTTTTTTTTMISTDNTASELETPTSTSPKKQQYQRLHRHYHFGQRSQSHLHLINCSNREECRLKIQQLIHDFYRVFEENARQNEQRMHQLYARVFQQGVDPMLAEDMQRLCLSVSAAPPPTLASLLQPGLSSAFGTFCATSDTMRDSFVITEHDNDAFDDMIFSVTLPSPPSPSISSSSSSSSSKKQQQQSHQKGKNRKWVKVVWHGITTSSSTTKQRQHRKQKQKQPRPPSPLSMQQHNDGLVENTGLMQHQQQQQQVSWSICLGLISEHLLYMGQQFYTKWICELSQAQHQQTTPLQLATKTLASMYRALQIEQGHAILSRLCTQLESCLLLP